MIGWLRVQNPWALVLGAITFVGLISIPPLVARNYASSFQIYSGTGGQLQAEYATTALLSWVIVPAVLVLTVGSALALLVLAAVRYRRDTAD